MWVGCLLLNRWAGARAPSPWSRRRRTPSDRARAGTGQPRHRHSCEPCPRRRPPAVTARSAASFDMALASPRPLIRLASGPPDDGHSRGAETKNPVMLLEGSCHCGAIRVRSARPYPFNLCYCNICRKTGGGGGHAINLGAEHESLEVEGEEHRSVYHAVMREGGRRAHQPGAAELLRPLRHLAVAVGPALAGPRASSRLRHRHRAPRPSRTHALDARRQALLGRSARRAEGPAIRRLPEGIAGRVARASGALPPRLTGPAVVLPRAERLGTRARRAFALKTFPATLEILEQLLVEVGESPRSLPATPGEKALTETSQFMTRTASSIDGLFFLSVADLRGRSSPAPPWTASALPTFPPRCSRSRRSTPSSPHGGRRRAGGGRGEMPATGRQIAFGTGSGL